MTLTKNKTIYINGTSKSGDEVLANFNDSFSENGTTTINETLIKNDSQIADSDFNEFREHVKDEFKKIRESNDEINNNFETDPVKDNVDINIDTDKEDPIKEDDSESKETTEKSE